jgi:hypothetical protein
MGRTIWYELHSPRELTWNEWKEIRAASAIMNLRCTWTCEELSFRFIDGGERKEFARDHHGDPGPNYWGLTKTAGDELNTMLVVQFLVWLSKRFEKMTIRLHDEGGLVRCGYLFLRRGEFLPDEERIERQRQYLVSCSLGNYVTELDAAHQDAKEGRFFDFAPAWEYRDRRELVALGISDEELLSLTVSDLAKRLPIPWFDTCATAT